jgi:hypothetical protein
VIQEKLGDNKHIIRTAASEIVFNQFLRSNKHEWINILAENLRQKNTHAKEESLTLLIQCYEQSL